MNKKWTESDIFCDAIGERTFADAADWLNEKLHADFQVTRQTVWNWAVGLHEPREEFVRALLLFYPMGDPRFELGLALKDRRTREMQRLYQKESVDA
jgi:hypothetical protein